jgi:predicted RNA-binding protein with EMAP domain
MISAVTSWKQLIKSYKLLHGICNSAGYDKKHVIELLKMADDTLQGFEYRYKLLKEEADELEHKNTPYKKHKESGGRNRRSKKDT